MLNRNINLLHVAKGVHRSKCHVFYRMTSTTQQKLLFKTHVTQLSINNVIVVATVPITDMNTVYNT